MTLPSAPGEESFSKPQDGLGLAGLLPFAGGELVGLVHGRVDVDGAEDLVQAQAVLHRQNELGDQLTGVGADDGRAQDAVLAGLGQDLDEARVGAVGNGRRDPGMQKAVLLCQVRAMGHREGLKATRKIIHACANAGVEVLTLFAFSSENWNRPEEEITALMDLFINALEKDIEIILITSEEKYAVEAFEKKVTDYLVKPIEYARFLQATHEAEHNIEVKRAATQERKEFYVRTDAKIVRIPFQKILFVEALADYVIIQTEAKKHIVHFTMKGIVSRLPEDDFVRTHRSYIVNLDKIEALEDNSILIGEKYIPIGASYKDALLDRLNFL